MASFSAVHWATAESQHSGHNSHTLQPIRVQWRRGERFSSPFKNIRTLRSFRKAPEGSFYNFYLSRNVEAINRFAIAALKRRNSVFSSGVSEEPLDFLGDLVRKLRLRDDQIFLRLLEAAGAVENLHKSQREKRSPA
eukprot:scaffold323_cov232-Pinguiococcus_pyrenoidosus.AAC.12